MSSSQVFPALTGTMDPGQMSSDASGGIVGTEWYAPTSYSYHDPYINQYPTATVEGQPWSQYARASVPELHSAAYSHHNTTQPQIQIPIQQMMKDPARPRSSPSTFGPSPESIPWTSGGLGIQYPATSGQPTPPVTSGFPPSAFHYPTDNDSYNTSSPPELRQPKPQRPYTAIAPNPIVAQAKRKRDDDDRQQETPSSAGNKKRRRTASVASQDLSEDDRFLVQLKEEESLPWKDIATRFQTEKGKNFQVAALQMRYKRLREKFRIWDEQDVNALKLAHEYWEKYKWEIIGAKMLDFGIAERWPARHCAKKWQDIEATLTATHASSTAAATAGMTPASISQFSSPVEGPVHFAFMPLPPPHQQ